MDQLLRRTGLGIALLVLTCAGCAGQHEQVEERPVADVHRDIIDQTLADSPSDLERAALQDSWVSDAEYHEAQGAFVSCMEDTGYDFTVQLHDDGGYDIQHPDDFVADHPDPAAGAAALDEMVLRCQRGTIAVLSMLYHSMRDNPEGIHPVQEMRDCFEQAGAPEAEVASDDELWRQVRGEPETLSSAASQCVTEHDAAR